MKPRDLVPLFSDTGSTGTIKIDAQYLFGVCGENPTLDEVLSATSLNIDMKLRPLNERERAIVERQFKRLMKPPPKPRPTYKGFIEYLACNDDEGMIMDGDPSVCVSMVGHMFGKDAQKVIADVRAYLEKNGG